MVAVSEVPITWEGTPVVGGGVSVLHCAFGDEHDLMTGFRAMLNTIKASFPTGIQWTFPGGGAVLNEANGDLDSAWVDPSPPAALAATGGLLYAPGVGARIKWDTGAFHNSHRVVGSTFLVPVTTANFEGAGAIDNTVLALWQGAVNTFVALGKLTIWSRPKPDSVGAQFTVASGQVPDAVSWLRGRRT